MKKIVGRMDVLFYLNYKNLINYRNMFVLTPHATMICAN